MASLGQVETVSITTVSAHDATARMGVREVVRQLNAYIGPTLVAATAGVKDRGLPTKWARDDGPRPRPTAETRLLKAHALFSTISHSEGNDVARAWMIGSNPMLDDDTPITAIREDRFKAVMGAATAFLDGSPA